MKLKIEIDLGNAAFEDNPAEISDLLENIASRMAWQGGGIVSNGGIVRDSNGNKCGFFEAIGD